MKRIIRENSKSDALIEQYNALAPDTDDVERIDALNRIISAELDGGEGEADTELISLCAHIIADIRGFSAQAERREIIDKCRKTQADCRRAKGKDFPTLGKAVRQVAAIACSVFFVMFIAMRADTQSALLPAKKPAPDYAAILASLQPGEEVREKDVALRGMLYSYTCASCEELLARSGMGSVLFPDTFPAGVSLRGIYVSRTDTDSPERINIKTSSYTTNIQLSKGAVSFDGLPEEYEEYESGGIKYRIYRYTGTDYYALCEYGGWEYRIRAFGKANLYTMLDSMRIINEKGQNNK